MYNIILPEPCPAATSRHGWEGWSKAVPVTRSPTGQCSSLGTGSPESPVVSAPPLRKAASLTSSDSSHLAMKRALGEEAPDLGAFKPRPWSGESLAQVRAWPLT